MQQQLRIMVLDASPISRKILEVIFRREGHQVACFADPLAALRFLCRQGPADLLFLGLDLPRIDGFEVLRRLRGKPRFRSMALVALLDEHDGVLLRLKARLAGAQQVVTKPLAPRRIAALVSAYPCQRTSVQEIDQPTRGPSGDDGRVAYCLGRTARDAAARAHTR